ncbi:hypothetical protein ALI144C_31485 [Actinosynnema sp. ALI-1.44]|uniref:hypothetical protein n=1 Tax=Actinosynnema sp. ALI-1.44 TaxID=1933779 RepID=UPI00097C5DD1|nr:hypothetical protein [Actinosynnema sp. ALI-1.44]ONI77924.1 hypothetical protein ALI144C_31485 [Actinosynnema sp. ALI-1.44]
MTGHIHPDWTDVLDRRLPPVDTRPTPSEASQLLRSLGIRLCCLDDTSRVLEPAPETYRTAEGILEAVATTNPGYQWDIVANGLVNVFPVPSVLDEPVPPLTVAGTGLWRVLEEHVAIPRYKIQLFMEFRDDDGPPVPADLPAGSVRAALNTLIAPVAQTVWHVSGTPDAWFLTVSAIA